MKVCLCYGTWSLPESVTVFLRTHPTDTIVHNQHLICHRLAFWIQYANSRDVRYLFSFLFPMCRLGNFLLRFLTHFIVKGSLLLYIPTSKTKEWDPKTHRNPKVRLPIGHRQVLLWSWWLYSLYFQLHRQKVPMLAMPRLKGRKKKNWEFPWHKRLLFL